MRPSKPALHGAADLGLQLAPEENQTGLLLDGQRLLQLTECLLRNHCNLLVEFVRGSDQGGQLGISRFAVERIVQLTFEGLALTHQALAPLVGITHDLAYVQSFLVVELQRFGDVDHQEGPRQATRPLTVRRLWLSQSRKRQQAPEERRHENQPRGANRTAMILRCQLFTG